jgi:hypothetical protein
VYSNRDVTTHDTRQNVPFETALGDARDRTWMVDDAIGDR